MRPSGKPEQIRPSIGLYFTDKPQTKFPMLLQLEHDGAINIPPGVRDFRSPTISPAAWTWTFWPSIRTRIIWARLMEGYATLPDGTRKWLIRIPDWDQNWQSVYPLQASPCFCPRAR